jgi:hypothetical protein
MSNGHGSSRRQAYGRRMKDLRSRRDTDLEIDLEGPGGWSRGGAWESDQQLPRFSSRIDQGASSARSS